MKIQREVKRDLERERERERDCVCVPCFPTSVAVVIHQDDFVDEVVGGPVGDGGDGPEQGGPALVVEGDDDAGVGKPVQVQLLSAAGGNTIRLKYRWWWWW